MPPFDDVSKGGESLICWSKLEPITIVLEEVPDAEDMSPIPDDNVIPVVLKGDSVEDPEELLKLWLCCCCKN